MPTIKVNGDKLLFLKLVLATTFAFALLVFLVTSNVRIAFNSLALMELQFERHGVSQTTGLTEAQLSETALQIRDYFNAKEELLSVILTSSGTANSMFNVREVEHMRDERCRPRIHHAFVRAPLRPALFVRQPDMKQVDLVTPSMALDRLHRREVHPHQLRLAPSYRHLCPPMFDTYAGAGLRWHP